ncbi:hypothetical protein BDR03DRAFT_1018177 [Suillus americanus]|nr:hypothetical protein BDR03DRAFT_1018177 [Suillus americanus]
MFTPLGQRWSLATIRWWGAWAEGKSMSGSLYSAKLYLLDELTWYEKNHRDALCPIPREGDKSFNGDHILTAPLSGKVEEVLDKLTLTPPVSSSSSPSPPPSQFSQLSISTPTPSLPSPPPAQPLQLTPSHEASHKPLSGSYTTSPATHNASATDPQLSPAPLSSAVIQIC